MPKSEENERCDATMSFGDDYGDNECTFHCELKKEHAGKHKESGRLHEQDYILEWEEAQP